MSNPFDEVRAAVDAATLPVVPARGTGAQILKERELTVMAIDGAIAFGYQGVNPPPEDDPRSDWLKPFWKIGCDLREKAGPVADGWELTAELIDAHLGLAYSSSGLNGMTGHAWDHVVARRFFQIGQAVGTGLIPAAPGAATPAPVGVRDKSEPGICAFYLSVGDAFKGVRFARATVDEAIDAQIDAARSVAQGDGE